MKTRRGVEVYLYAFFELEARWRWVASFTPRPLYPQGNSPPFPLDRRLGGPQSRSGRGGQEKSSHSPPGIEPLNSDRPACRLVAIPTELSTHKDHQSPEDRIMINTQSVVYYKIYLS
jgi:hypothetical protein